MADTPPQPSTQPNPQTFTLSSLSLKLDDPSSLESYIGPLTNPHTATQIKHLNLSGNTIGAPAAAHLSPLLSSLQALETANLSDIFTSRLLSEIPPALESLLTGLLSCPRLERIELSDNAFGLNTQAPLVKYLGQAVSLRHLVLNNNGLGPEAGSLVAGALSQLASAKTAAGREGEMLETVICGRNRLENGSAAAWGEALRAHSACLKEVRLAQNGIRVEGMGAILAGLKNAKGLRVLDVGDNLLTVKGAKALCNVLPGWGEIRELQVGDTLMKARGGVLLAETLGKGRNKELEVLRCQYNEVDSRGVRALVEAVDVHEALPRLRRVEVNGNRFNEEDGAVERLGEILSERKREAGVEGESEEWGLDELDELESEDEDEEDEDEGSEVEDEDDKENEVEKKGDKELRQADQAENENVAPEEDHDVDALADKLERVEINEGDDDDDREDEVEKKGNKELRQADHAENENVAAEKDDDIDALTDEWGKTGLLGLY